MATTFDRARTDTLALLDEAVAQLVEHDHDVADTVADARRRLADGRVSVAVVGEFKRGKSTLVAALVEEPDLFPTDVDIATNLVTSAEYGSPETLTVYLGDPTHSRPTAISRQQIADFVTEGGNPGNRRAAQLLRVRTPSARLRDGLILLDTPGVGGLNPQHSAITYAVLGSADVVLFVIDALSPMTREELELLERIAKLGTRIVVAVTKIDKVAAYTAIVDDTSAKLAAVLGSEAAARVPVVPVSGSAKIDWLDTGDEEALEVSNFAELEDTLGVLLADSGGGLLVNRSLAVLARQLDALLTPLSSELTAIEASAEDVAHTTDELRTEGDRLSALLEPQAGWRARLVTAMEDVREEAEASLLARLDEIGRALERQLHTADLATGGDALLARVEGDVTLAWLTTGRRVSVAVATISDDLERQTGLRVNPIVPEGGSLVAFTTFGHHRGTDDAGASWLQVVGSLAGFAAFLFDGSGTAAWLVNSLSGLVSRKVAGQRRRDAFAASARDQLTRASRELQDRLSEVIAMASGSILEQYERLIAEDTGRVRAATVALEVGDVAPDRAADVSARITALQGLRDRAQAVLRPLHQSAAV